MRDDQNTTPYHQTGILESWRKRIPWLLLLTVSAAFTGSVISHFEGMIGSYAILTTFLPMLMDTGGNAGAQTSVTVIRGLSLGEIEPRELLRVLCKELCIALLCGITLACVVFLKIMVIDFRLQATAVLENGLRQNNLLIATLVSLTVLGAVLLAKTVGVLLPIAAKKLGADPAVAASPFITTIVDTLTLLLYFGMASAFLNI